MDGNFFSNTPSLESEQLLLRPTTVEDAKELLDIIVYDGVFAETEEDARAIIVKILDDVKTGSSLHWCISLKESRCPIGTVGFYRGFADNIGEIGYILKKEYRGRGLMTEAIRLVVSFGLDTLNLKNIVAYTSPENSPSIAVLKKCGFRGSDPAERSHNENAYLAFTLR